MSRIVAIFNPDDRPVDPRFLGRVGEAAAYRGHDGLGKFATGPIGLAYAACHTTPQALGEAQPFAGRNGDLVIAFDGRVDNRDELVSAMRAHGVEARGAGDAGLVVCAWRCWGEDTPRRLLGDFAFALWDSRARRLICVRDPAGVKPLYYAADAHTFLAASELHQVLMHPRVGEYPNAAMAAEYMCGTLLGREETMFRDVLRLPPGEMLIVSRGGIARRRYYELTPGKAIRYRTDAEYAEHFLDVFGEAVRCRMVASGAGVASDLSGGLDSSFIVGVAQALIRDGSCSPDRFETYSIWATDPGADEYDYFRAVIDMWRLHAHIVRPCIVDRQSCVELLRHYRDFAEYPNGSTYVDINFQARRNDFRVMLSGSGGDHWLQGSDDYCADLLLGLRFGRLMTVLGSGHGCISAGSDWRGGLRMLARHAMVPLLPLALQKALRCGRRDADAGALSESRTRAQGQS